MARFSLGREEEDGDEGSGPSSPRPISKRPKTTRCTASSPPPRHVPPPPSPPPEVNPTETDEEEDGEQIGEEEEEEEDSEYEAEEEEEEGEDLEEEEEEDGEDDEDAEAVFRLEEDGLRSRVEGCLNEVPTSDGSISVTLTDPDVLDCPICLEHLSIPVFQCENGHVACSSCCLKIRNRCPSCSWPIGYNRCRRLRRFLNP